MPHSRAPCQETSTSAYGWATMNINKPQTSNIKVVIQEGCITNHTNVINTYHSCIIVVGIIIITTIISIVCLIIVIIVISFIISMVVNIVISISVFIPTEVYYYYYYQNYYHEYYFRYVDSDCYTYYCVLSRRSCARRTGRAGGSASASSAPQ